MRILHAVHNFPPEFLGGTEAYVDALIAAQRARGDEPGIVCGSEALGTAESVEDRGGASVLRLRHDGIAERFGIECDWPRLARRFDARLAELAPDVVHVHHFFNFGAPLVSIAKARGIACVATLHDYFALCPRFFLLRPDGGYCGDETPVPRERCVDCCLPEVGGARAALDEAIARRRESFRRELERADRVLAPSRSVADTVARTAIAGALPIEVLPLGLLRELAPAPRVASDGRLRLAFFGNAAPVKGLDVLLQAIERLDDARRARVSLTVLGRAVDAGLEARLAAARGFALHREGEYDAARLARLGGETDVAVFPSLAPETYSLVVDEALALGLGLIVTSRGAAAERAGDAAIVVRPGDVEDLKRAIESLLDSPSRVEGLRSRARSQVFTIARHADRLDAIYRAARSAPRS